MSYNSQPMAVQRPSSDIQPTAPAPPVPMQGQPGAGQPGGDQLTALATQLGMDPHMLMQVLPMLLMMLQQGQGNPQGMIPPAGGGPIGVPDQLRGPIPQGLMQGTNIAAGPIGMPPMGSQQSSGR